MPKKNSNGEYGLCNGCGNWNCRECGGRKPTVSAGEQAKRIAKHEVSSVAREIAGVGKDLGKGFSDALSDLAFGTKRQRRNNPFW